MTTLLAPSYDPDAARAAAQACGGQLADDPHGPQVRFAARDGDAPTARELLGAGAVALLADWGIVSVAGEERVAFLHAQTTNDLAQQPADAVRLHGYCTPKGRLLAGGPLWHDGELLRLAVSRPLAEPLRRRLSMFVLRARAQLADDSNRFAVLGLVGRAAPEALRALGIEPPPAPGRLAQAQGAAALGFAALEALGPRFWLIVPVEALPDAWHRLAQRLRPVDSDLWRTTEILAGEPRIVAATSEAFVPQTLNWELIGGVSFRKGCYPGQEVVARMHYRGTPKRRLFAAQLPAGPALAPGADLLEAASGQPAGRVVSFAPGLDEANLLLFEAPIATARESALKSTDGRRLAVLPLPYPLEP